MRPGQNKRLRGRNNNNNNHGRKGPNPLTRSFESNGPDVKIRGTAQHIAEKYLQLARDAQTSGDPVMAENYLQHAEHYYRVITSAQQAQQQAMGLIPRPAQEPEEEDDGMEEDDRFASVADRLPPVPQPAFAAQGQQPSPPQQQPQPNFQGGQPGGQPQPYGGQGGGDRQPYGGGQQRPWRDNNRGDHRQEGRGDGRQQEGRQDNRGEGRQEGRGQDFRGEPRFEGRGDASRSEAPRPEGGERPDNRFGGGNNRPWRNDERRPPRDNRENNEPAADMGGGLPAFITGSRPPVEAAPAMGGPEPELAPADTEAGYHLRPRRRRRGRPGNGPDGFGDAPDATSQDASPQDDTAPVTD